MYRDTSPAACNAMADARDVLASVRLTDDDLAALRRHDPSAVLARMNVQLPPADRDVLLRAVQLAQLGVDDIVAELAAAHERRVAEAT